MDLNEGIDVKKTMVVVSMEEEWSSLKSLLQDSDGGGSMSFSSWGTNHVCDVEVDGRLMSLHYTGLKQDMTEENIRQAMDSCFQSVTQSGSSFSSFLLLLPGGNYTERERRLVEILQVHFGVRALRYLTVLSLDGGKVVSALDASVLELIHVCSGRFCRLTGSPGELGLLLQTVDCLLSEHGGYTGKMLSDAKRRNTEDSAMEMLKQKLREAEEKEEAFRRLVQSQEERRAKEMEEVKSKHAEERAKEAAETRQHETRRESLEEVVRSHRAMLQRQVNTSNTSNDDDVRKTSVVLLGLSGSGKSSARNLILQRAGDQYSTTDPDPQVPEPTAACERKWALLADGRRLLLVDTPELWDEDGVENLDLVKDCLALALPGPHVFLLVLQVGRFTRGESEMLGRLQKIFGREFTDHAVVLFTRGDARHGAQRIEDHLTGAHASLRDLVRRCGSRYYALNVRNVLEALNYPQVKDLLSGVNKLVASHGGSCYVTKRFSIEELKERRKLMEERN